MDLQGYKEITVDATVKNLTVVNDFVEELLAGTDCSVKTKLKIDLVVEEIFVNIANYAYKPDTGDADILIETMDSCPIPEDAQKDMSESEKKGKWLRVTLSDSGTPFNPLSKEDPDVTLPAQERRIGGLGIFMVKKSMDYMYYEFKDDKNNISICKKLK